MSKPINRKGYDALWEWFGLSYAGFLVLPRVLMHEMPDDWQRKMVKLLREYEETFDNVPDVGTPMISLRKNRRVVRLPGWLTNYRHPDKRHLATMRSAPSAAGEGATQELSDVS